MTRDEIINMAREAGFHAGQINLFAGEPVDFIAPASATTCIVELERFAALVAEKEREACASHIEDCTPPVGMHGNRIEIGAVARTCYADAIRARSQQ